MKNPLRNRTSRPSFGRAAFTLLEVLVALGAVALMSLGLARIFGATSQTLRAGKRVSHFNDYARSLEVTMRRDFERMTREGFLVIAHELTDAASPGSGLPEGIRRSPTDVNPRQRRIDQIMFFTAGQYRTQRTPAYPSRVASGAQACIYYGHGLRQDPGNPNISVPCLDDRNRDGGNSDSGVVMDIAPAFGERGSNGADGPNQYAADWVLLRHISVLAQPKAKAPPRPTNITFPTVDQWEDSPIQIDLTPAQSSLFRNIARGTPDTLPPANRIARLSDPVARPLRSSGLVDVINTDLGEVRSIILDAQPIAVDNLALRFDPAADELFDTYNYLDAQGIARLVKVPYAFQPDVTPAGTTACAAMKQWMLQALPAEPRQQTATGGVQPPRPYPASSPDFGGRIRCEIAPPDYLGTGANNGQIYLGADEYRRTDQTMLTASNFAPACTEFIVEWSFGETYRGGTIPDPFLSGTFDPRADQLIWHGLPRWSETDYLPGLDPRLDQVAAPYLGKATSNPLPGQVGDAPIDAHAGYTYDGVNDLWTVPARVIHEPVNGQGLPDPRAGEPLYSLFGYVDPTFPGPVAPADFPEVCGQIMPVGHKSFGRSELSRQFEARLVEIHGNDPGPAAGLERLDN